MMLFVTVLIVFTSRASGDGLRPVFDVVSDAHITAG